MLNTLIICSSARLARSITHDINLALAQTGAANWQSPQVLKLSAWLDRTIEEALLCGEITQAHTLLSPFNEAYLWQQVIQNSLKQHVFGDLFDVAGLAESAAEAHRYMVAWQLHMPRDQLNEEARQFLQWQRAFLQACDALKVMDGVRHMAWQLDCLAKANIKLPEKIAFAGFDQTAPLEARLRDILMNRGVQISEYATTALEAAQTQQVCVDNIDAECRAAVAWAQQQLAQNPNAKLAIITPKLNEIRNQLADLLDDTFQPHSLHPSQFDAPRNYNFSLGTPLNQQPMVQSALNLLRLFSRYTIAQADFSSLLLSPFWSKNSLEANARATLDAKMREKLAASFTLKNWLNFAQQQLESGLNISHCVADITAASAHVSPKKLTGSAWAQTFSQLLAALNWPGDRAINSLEFQTMQTWQKALQQLAQLDVLNKPIGMAEAVAALQHICQDLIFQPETTHMPSLQILGIMEALSAPVDAAWVMQMNDHIWPPPAHPNPLLPAHLQRAAKLPNADNSVQMAFASTIHTRLLHSAKQVVFSYSLLENTAQLRASSLLHGITRLENIALASTLAEQLAAQNEQDLSVPDSAIVDAIAPAVAAGDHVRGGTGLFRAQAICPAWAFYQYRLGAKALKTPTAALDNLARGALVHEVLRLFWQPNQLRHFADLRAMKKDALEQTLNTAITQALHDFAEANKQVHPIVLKLEHERLFKLVGAWLHFEFSEQADFNMLACEFKQKVNINGIEVTLIIDRIQQLKDGELVFVDYKTGQEPKTNNWAAARLTEPQLPIYAAFGATDKPIAGVQFGWVKVAQHRFVGVCAQDFEPEPEQRKPKWLQAFSDWPSLLNHWKTSIEAIADEIKQGQAAVNFTNANDLMYCEVLPLLRLPERDLQFERLQK